MKSNYKPIGKYIREVKTRNIDGTVSNLLGINIDKYFMPSVANIIGTDMTKYKVVKKGQYACNRMHVGRDKRLPVALSTSDEDFLVSPAYDVFEIKDENTLNPEYLMMWFSRKEFDRNAWFYTDADVRGGLHWKEFCNIQLPIPSLEKQKEIVAEYNTIVSRIKLNEQLNQKLVETAQAVYKQWFVDFEFPISKEYAAEIGKPELEGKPYKSSGGKMDRNDELDLEIPEGWEIKPFTIAVQLGGGGTPSTEISEYWNGNIPFYTPGDLNESYYCITTLKHITDLGLKKCSSRLYRMNTSFVTARGATVGGVCLAGVPMAMNQTCYAVNSEYFNDYYAHQLTRYIISKLKNEAIGATFGALVTKDFAAQHVIKPELQIEYMFEKQISKVYEQMLLKMKENKKLYEIRDLLFSKMTKVEATA